mmetsp:Transcript_133472/g.188561  ORF Transcript_133472/g.188561 Transcript_133472/m.188561 type:complete len:273 (-) Transcript_133472:93-911(-)
MAMEARSTQRPAANRRAAFLGVALAAATGLFSWAFVGEQVPRQPGLRSPLVEEEPSLVARPARGPKVQTRRGTSPYYSNEDRERLARRRQEVREQVRADKQSHKPDIQLDKLPPIEDVYNLQYSGDVDVDPVGGRKRYTYWVMFKRPAMRTSTDMKKILAEYMFFFKKKMSCRNIRITPRKSPIGPNDSTSIRTSVVTLEYEMKEYGEIPRGQKLKNKYQQAYMIEINLAAPVTANRYIQKKFYTDNNILRFMCISQTRSFNHAGEDNVLLL